MTKTLLFSLMSIALILTACSQKRPSTHPKNPKYEIIKPKVKYAPSRKSLAKMVKQLQGSPYVWAEEGPNKFDCSGFTYYLYGSMGIEIPRVAREQAKVGKRIGVEDLEYGDLIFFATNRHNRRRITHVGMYLGNGWFTHASTTKHEVIYSNLYTSPYYKKRLRVCRRYLPDTHKTTLASRRTQEALWKTKQTAVVVAKATTTAYKARGTTTKENKKAIVIKAPMKEIMQPASSQGTYYVQVGSFIGKPKAALLSKIRSQGFSYRLIGFTIGGKKVSKLLIGPYRTHGFAQTILAKVRAKIQKNAFIAQIK